ncbi:HD domain-containing protein [Actinokineospora xionganensis]|uniref:HD domain-containing protein n=1 Tax=Actinokineospora xionganensis TaxID=2684470 RepID=A0ABR7LGN6_9PSEU|nr:HD domain-containing protein [Actinokineospora xionganensis]MBC6451722.1 HD domain-containing protein [Actinokineospora xionganensis]
MEIVGRSRALAELLVSPLGRRWRHVHAVADRAQRLCGVVDGEGDILVAAAWLHDVGYAPEVRKTGFHALDGARYLRDDGYPDRIVCLVAHHSGARFEAKERGFEGELAVFELEDSPVMDALITADLTTAPDGSACTYDQRIDEVLARYPVDHPVYRTWSKAREVIGASVRRTEERLANL